MTFVQRRLQLTIKLAQAPGGSQPTTFAGQVGDQVTLSDHRASVRIQNSGGVTAAHASISIWGMSQSIMNQLSTLGMRIQQVPRNTLTVLAGDAGGNMSTAYVGTIQNAFGEFNSQPDVPFKMDCLSGLAENAIPFSPSSYAGGVDVAVVMSAIAGRAGWGFENDGVKGVTVGNPYLPGAALEQVRKLARAARINAQLVPGARGGNTLAIWPLYGNRSATLGQPIPVAPIQDGGDMIGYPSYTAEGIIVRNLFDPRFALGGQVKLTSSLPQTSRDGVWTIYKLDHALEAAVPKGKWESILYCYNQNFNAPAPQPPA